MCRKRNHPGQPRLSEATARQLTESQDGGGDSNKHVLTLQESNDSENLEGKTVLGRGEKVAQNAAGERSWSEIGGSNAAATSSGPALVTAMLCTGSSYSSGLFAEGTSAPQQDLGQQKRQQT
ncbi:UNVERIFIED_CONTAM: hypothetical protein K2H54_060502 [Gekko kuhli]